jgi:hypothetical protein
MDNPPDRLRPSKPSDLPNDETGRGGAGWGLECEKRSVGWHQHSGSQIDRGKEKFEYIMNGDGSRMVG